MKFNGFYLVSCLTGVICGFLSTHVFVIGWWNLIFWGMVGIIVGFFTKEKKTALRSGSIYGFFLSMCFFLSGFQGVREKFAGFLVFSLGLSIIGAFGGTMSFAVGYFIKRKLVSRVQEYDIQ